MKKSLILFLSFMSAAAANAQNPPPVDQPDAQGRTNGEWGSNRRLISPAGFGAVRGIFTEPVVNKVNYIWGKDSKDNKYKILFDDFPQMYFGVSGEESEIDAGLTIASPPWTEEPQKDEPSSKQFTIFYRRSGQDYESGVNADQYYKGSKWPNLLTFFITSSPVAATGGLKFSNEPDPILETPQVAPTVFLHKPDQYNSSIEKFKGETKPYKFFYSWVKNGITGPPSPEVPVNLTKDSSDNTFISIPEPPAGSNIKRARCFIGWNDADGTFKSVAYSSFNLKEGEINYQQLYFIPSSQPEVFSGQTGQYNVSFAWVTRGVVGTSSTPVKKLFEKDKITNTFITLPSPPDQVTGVNIYVEYESGKGEMRLALKEMDMSYPCVQLLKLPQKTGIPVVVGGRSGVIEWKEGGKTYRYTRRLTSGDPGSETAWVPDPRTVIVKRVTAMTQPIPAKAHTPPDPNIPGILVLYNGSSFSNATFSGGEIAPLPVVSGGQIAPDPTGWVSWTQAVTQRVLASWPNNKVDAALGNNVPPGELEAKRAAFRVAMAVDTYANHFTPFGLKGASKPTVAPNDVESVRRVIETVPARLNNGKTARAVTIFDGETVSIDMGKISEARGNELRPMTPIQREAQEVN